MSSASAKAINARRGRDRMKRQSGQRLRYATGAGLFQHFHVAAWHAAEIGRIRGQHRKAVANCGFADDEVESSERCSSPERAHELRVDARDFKVKRQRVEQLEDLS